MTGQQTHLVMEHCSNIKKKCCLDLTLKNTEKYREL